MPTSYITSNNSPLLPPKKPQQQQHTTTQKQHFFTSIYFLFQIAMGLPLHCLKDIRCLYSENPFGSTAIDFEHPAIRPQHKGHVIAARITSENPDEVRLVIVRCLFNIEDL